MRAPGFVCFCACRWATLADFKEALYTPRDPPLHGGYTAGMEATVFFYGELDEEDYSKWDYPVNNIPQPYSARWLQERAHDCIMRNFAPKRVFAGHCHQTGVYGDHGLGCEGRA